MKEIRSKLKWWKPNHVKVNYIDFFTDLNYRLYYCSLHKEQQDQCLNCPTKIAIAKHYENVNFIEVARPGLITIEWSQNQNFRTPHHQNYHN